MSILGGTQRLLLKLQILCLGCWVENRSLAAWGVYLYAEAVPPPCADWLGIEHLLPPEQVFHSGLSQGSYVSCWSPCISVTAASSLLLPDTENSSCGCTCGTRSGKFYSILSAFSSVLPLIPSFFWKMMQAKELATLAAGF